MAAFIDDDTDSIQSAQHVPDRPARPKPASIRLAPSSPWLPTGQPAKAGGRSDTKTAVARVGGIILSLAGVAVIIFIGIQIAGMLIGVYNNG